jgi:predicted nucleic acid-binding protein
LIHETVLDTNVLVAALRSKRGASHQLLRLIGEGEWRLNIPVSLALEYEEVLKRNRLLPGLSEPRWTSSWTTCSPFPT